MSLSEASFMKRRNIFATTLGVAIVGLIIGGLASFLQKSGNPPNMGICVACFERDIAGALGLHKAAIVQYLRPEIMGLGLGACIAALLSGDFRARGGSSTIVRFLLGMMAAIGALVFLGCPWRALLRLAGGDLNAIFGLLGLACGIFIATLFMRKGYSLGRSKNQPVGFALIFPAVLIILLALRFIYPPIEGETRSGFLWYSLKGPGSMHADIFISLVIGLVIGAIAQRSRFCTMGAFRDLFLFKQHHLLCGVVALVVGAFIMNLVFGQIKVGFEGQPVAHDKSIWNFLGMVISGLAFAFAGGCPGRQLFMGGEGDFDAATFALGLLAGAAVAHNFATASSAVDIGANAPVALGICFALLMIIGVFYSRQKA